jgi:hypothetical protein
MIGVTIDTTKLSLRSAGPEIVNHVENETLDVGPIVIGVSHDHETTVPKLGDIRVLLTLAEDPKSS